MPTLKVPQEFATVQAAVNAASPADVINISSAYSATEAVSVATDNLSFTGTSQAAVTLDLDAITTIRIGGSLPFTVVGDIGTSILPGTRRTTASPLGTAPTRSTSARATPSLLVAETISSTCQARRLRSTGAPAPTP